MQSENHLPDKIRAAFTIEKKDIRTYTPLKLAYLGDAVFEIIVRTLIIEGTGGPVKKLHSRTSSLVNAGMQARLADAMQTELTEDERAAYRHGKNAKASSVAKHADPKDYRNATGLEALFGYLYLTGDMNRAVELLKFAMAKLGTDICTEKEPI